MHKTHISINKIGRLVNLSAKKKQYYVSIPITDLKLMLIVTLFVTILTHCTRNSNMNRQNNSKYLKKMYYNMLSREILILWFSDVHNKYL